VDKQGRFLAPSGTFNPRDSVGIRSYVVDLPTSTALSGAQVFVEVRDAGGGLVVSLQGFSDETGTAELKWKTGRREAPGAYSATVVEVIKSGYVFDPTTGQVEVGFTIE
jgi:hypothetical protein